MCIEDEDRREYVVDSQLALKLSKEMHSHTDLKYRLTVMSQVVKEVDLKNVRNCSFSKCKKYFSSFCRS